MKAQPLMQLARAVPWEGVGWAFRVWESQFPGYPKSCLLHTLPHPAPPHPLSDTARWYPRMPVNCAPPSPSLS